MFERRASASGSGAIDLCVARAAVTKLCGESKEVRVKIHFWVKMGHFEPFLTILAIFSHFWPFLAIYGHFG